MKQLSVFVSRDLESRVEHAFDHAGIDTYLRIGDATGVRFTAAGQLPRTTTWDAALFVIPAADEGAIRTVMDELRQFAGTCEFEPCLRMVVTSVDEVH
jgi:hypothetical protein